MKYRNSEGYASPTEYYALGRIQREEKKSKYQPLVYICSPFSHGDVKQNVQNARKYCRFASDHNCIPFAPHLLYPQFLNDNIPDDRSRAFFMNKVMLGKCDELWVFGSIYTAGMQKEIKWARRKKLTIRFFDENMKGASNV